MVEDIVVHNVQGLYSKLKDIKATYFHYASVMCLTETWLHPSRKDVDIASDAITVVKIGLVLMYFLVFVGSKTGVPYYYFCRVTD